MSKKPEKTAIIIGAGPAGLTAAFEMLDKKTGIKPIIYEASNEIGGISRTINYKGNRIDIGGHRFFSKSDRVMDWWRNIMPTQGALSKDDLLINIKYQGKTREVKLDPNGPDPETTDLVMLVRNRLSRIFYLRKFFSYPVNLSTQTVKNLGAVRITRIGLSYTKARLFPIKNEVSLEDFFINRFGKELYLTFFKDYTEKVWGVPCNQITAEWGAQRIKGLSISKALAHAAKSIMKKKPATDIAQKEVETSLIEHFLYPKFGPGQMWEEVARRVVDGGGEIHMKHEAVGITKKGNKITGVKIKDKDGKVRTVTGDYYFSTMPIKDLIAGMDGDPLPDDVREVAEGLMYRDFITVGLLLKKMLIKNETERKTVGNIVPDNWIYIQERDVKVGRLQIFNNWSPYMVKDYKKTVWVGMEYFVQEGDDLWKKSKKDMAEFGIGELAKIGMISPKHVLDSTVIHVKKTYPAYFGTYDRFDEIKDFVNDIDNLFLIGRNGMHRYNNQDHSMLAAMTAVENIINNRTDKTNLWEVNAEKEYHESK